MGLLHISFLCNETVAPVSVCFCSFPAAYAWSIFVCAPALVFSRQRLGVPLFKFFPNMRLAVRSLLFPMSMSFVEVKEAILFLIVVSDGVLGCFNPMGTKVGPLSTTGRCSSLGSFGRDEGYRFFAGCPTLTVTEY